MDSLNMNQLFCRECELLNGNEIKVFQSEIGDVGCVVWDAAIVLGKFIDHWCDKSSIVETRSPDQNLLTDANFVPGILGELFCNFPGKHCLELGAGTGYVGLVAATYRGKIVITDLPEFVPLMEYNIQQNSSSIRPSDISAKALTWGKDLPGPEEQFDLILVADCVYYDEALDALIDTLVAFSSPSTNILCCHEVRQTDHKIKLQARFFQKISQHFNVVQVPIELQHEEYRSDDILIHIFTSKS